MLRVQINRAGKMSDDKRNETQLLVAILGVESLVEEITFKLADDADNAPTATGGFFGLLLLTCSGTDYLQQPSLAHSGAKTHQCAKWATLLSPAFLKPTTPTSTAPSLTSAPVSLSRAWSSTSRRPPPTASTSNKTLISRT